MRSLMSSLFNVGKTNYEVVITKFNKEEDVFVSETESQLFEGGSFDEAQELYYKHVVSCASIPSLIAKVEFIKGKKVIGTEVFGDIETAKNRLKSTAA